jgi:N-hydroxyarylamine O-acetyltransferase
VSIDSELQTAYLRRLGLEAEPASVEALQRLHRRQVERIPYETMWLHAGEMWGIDPVDSLGRIAFQGRGGYCYHLNGAFAELLRSLGYVVARHVGGVHGPDGPNADSAGNHVLLTVSGLPSDQNPTGSWYVDAGLGDALYEALPLAAGPYEQAPFRLRLDETEGGTGNWHLAHDPAGGFVGMGWTAAEAEMAEFTAKQAWLSTSPDSAFTLVAMAEHRDATGVDVIRGLLLTRIGDTPAAPKPLTDRRAWFDALADVFDLRFDASPPEALDHLWDGPDQAPGVGGRRPTLMGRFGEMCRAATHPRRPPEPFLYPWGVLQPRPLFPMRIVPLRKTRAGWRRRGNGEVRERPNRIHC